MNLFRRVVAVLIVVLRWSVDRCVLALVAVALMTSLSAADRTWDGGGGDDNWTTPANWDGDVTAPSAGDNLIFTGTTRTTPNNNFAADTAFGSITFDNTAGAFTIGGNRIVLSGSITNDDGDLQTLNLAIGGNFIVTGSSGAITLNGNISAGSPVTKNGSHVLTLGGTGDNSGVGLTANAGTVILAKTSSASVHAIGGSTLTINSGATVQLGGTGGDQIYFTGNVVVDAGGVFDVNGLSEMINGLSGAGSVLNAGGGTATLTVGGNGASTTFSGTLSNSSGTLALAKMGTGTLTLSGTNTYSGSTLVSAGTVVIGNNAALGADSAGTTVASGATLNLNGFSLGAEPVAISGSGVGGVGALINNGATTLDALRYLSLDADATVGGTGRFDVRFVTTPLTTASYTGNGFTLTKVGSAQFSLVSVTTNTVGNIVVNAGTFSVESATVIGAGGNLTLGNGAVLKLYQNTDFSRPIIVNGNASLDPGVASGVVSTTSDVTINGGVLTCESEGTSLTLSGIIGGTGSLVKTGPSPVILSGTNAYTGTTTVNAGTLRNGAAAVIPDGSAVTVASGATYDLNNFNETVGSIAGAGTIALGSATLTAGGNNTTTALSGIISGTGAVAKAGTGTWTLSGQSSYSGGTTVTNGLVVLATSGGAVTGPIGTGAITLDSGANTARILLQGGETIANALVMTSITPGFGNGGLQHTGSGVATWSGPLTINANHTNGGHLRGGATVADALVLSGALTTGGTLTRMSQRTGFVRYSGTPGTIPQVGVSGTAQWGVSGAFPVATTFYISSSSISGETGTLDLNGFDQTVGGVTFQNAGGGIITTGAGTLTVNGTIAAIFTGTLDGGVNTISGKLNLGGATQTVSVADSSAASDLTIAAVISNGGLTKTGTGALTLTGTNTYTGVTTISGGTLSVGDGTTDGSIATSSGITNNAALVYNLAGVRSYANVISGTGTLTKAGTGTLTLSATNTYIGTTTVNSGILSVTGSTAVGSAVTVSSGGTLTGTGTVAGTVAVANGGTLSPGVANGLTASFVATSLRAVTQDDWRTTQTIAGTRSDALINQSTDAFGSGAERASYGISGNDSNWDNFSAQWDGYLRVATAGTTLSTRSDDGSRVWLDLNGNDTVDSGEWGSNGWGGGQGETTRTVHSSIPVGTYRMRVQYEEGNGGNAMYLLWNDAANSAGIVDTSYHLVPSSLLVGGSGIGTLTTGAVTFNASSTYTVDLNGTTPTYDQVSTAGAVTCAGTLTIGSIANAALGKVYTIVNAGSRSGAFSGLAHGDLFTQQGRVFQIAYTSTTVTLTDVAHPTTRIWDGGGADNNWSTAANWDYDIAPIAGDDLQFAGTTRLTPNNDFPGETSFASITFNSGAGAFVIGPTGGSTGVISREVWTGIGTTDISSIPLTTTANINDTLTSLEAPTSWADNYGTRIRGFVTAPTTGNYTFWVASDDNSELRLSTDVQAANKVLIASVTGFTASQEWGKYVSQKSAEIALIAGQKYYIEVLQKEGGGSDNLAVGWAKPGEATTAPSEVIPGAYLTPYATNYGIALAGAITNNSTNLQTVNLGLYLGASRSIDCASGNITLGGIVSGSGGLTKVGTNALSLGGANVFAGGVSLNAGTLNLNHASALGTGAGTFVITGGTTIDNTSGASITLTGNNPQTWNGDFTFTGSNALHLGGGAIAMGAATRQVTVSASTLSLGGAIGGAGGLTKQGNGTLRLAGVSTYAGATDVVAGTLALGVPQVSGFGATGTGWSLNGGSTVAGDVLTLTDNNGNQARSAFKTTRVPLGGFTTSFHYQAGGDRAADGTMFVLHNDTRGASALGSPGGALAYAGGGGAITPSAGIAINLYTAVTRGTGYRTGGNVSSPYTSTAPVDLGNGNVIAVTLKYDGTNLLTQTLRDLTTGDTWSTTYTVGDLTTTVGGSSAYVGFTGSTGGQVATQQISSFSFNTGGNNLLPTTTALSIAAGATVDLGGKDQQVASLANYGGAGGSVTNNGMEDSSLTVSGSGSTTFAGVISDGASNRTALVKDGSSTLTLTGTNTFTGTTTITTGTLSIGDGTTDGSITGSSGITDNAALIYNVVGSRTYGNVISGTGTLSKSGAGTLTLSGANTYTGTTTVGAGTLLVTGSTAAGSAVGVGNTATLGGTGTVAGTISLGAGATLAPGTGGTTIGTLAAGAVNCNATSVYSVDLNGTGPTADRTSSTGAVALAGTLTVASITNAAYLKTYTIVSGSSISGTFSGLPNHTLFTQQGRNFLITYNATTVTLTDLDPTYVWVWDGGGGDDNWTTAANWVNDVEPALGAALQFAGTTRLTPNNDFPAATSFTSITFNSGAGAFVMGGNSVTLTGDITNNDDSVQTMNQAMIMAATRTMNAASGNLVFGGALSGAGGLTKSGAGMATLIATNSYTGVTTISAGTFSIGDGTTNGSIATSSGITNNAALLYNLVASNTYANVISGTGTLTKSGAGTLTLSGGAANTYSGLTTVTAGQLALNKTSGSNAIGGNLAITGGRVSFGANHQLADSCAVTMSGATSVFNGTAVNTGQLTNQVETIASLTMSGGVFNTGATGTITITGALSCTGGASTCVVGNSGTRLACGSLSLTAMTGVAGVTVGTADSFTIYGNSTAQQSWLTVGAGGITLNGSRLNLRRGAASTFGSKLVLNGDITTSGSATSTISEDAAGGVVGGIALELSSTAAAVTRTVTVNAGGADLTIGVPITNGAATPGALTKAGTGTLTFTGTLANTYSGVTTITDGNLVLQKTADVNAIAGDITLGNASASDVLRLGASNQIADTSVLTFVSGGGGNSAKLELNGYLETLAGIQGNANQASVIQNTESGAAVGPNDPAILTVTNTADYVYDGLIRNGGGGTIGLSKSGAGILTLRCGFSSTAMNYTGATTVSAGRLVIDNLSTYASPVTNTSVAADALTFTQTSQNLTYALAISGSGAVTKNGAGTLTLSGTNSHTGATTVSVGTLLVTGSTASGSAVAVSSGATLGGSGTVAGTVAVADGGTLAPGTGGTTIATLTTGAVTLNASSTYAVDLNGTTPTFDQVSTSSTVACAGTLTITSLANAALGKAYTIVAAGTVSGEFSGRAHNSVFIHGGRLFRITYSPTTVILTDVAPVISSRQTLDVDGDGQIDRIRLTFDQNLNDDTSGLTVTVAGYAVTGFNVGTANDNVIDVLLTESGAGDTGATPAVRITVNSSLMDTAGTTLIQVEGSGTAATDSAAPVLLSTLWTDADSNGVDAGDTIALVFSESVVATSMVVADLGLGVTGDSLATSTIADQTGSTLSVVLVGTPLLTPGGVYASGSTTAGYSSGLYLASNAHVVDQAVVPNSAATGTGVTAVDLGPGTARVLSAAWVTEVDPKTWAVGSVAYSATNNTVTAGRDLRIRNTGDGAVEMVISTGASAPSGWTPDTAAGTNTYLMKCDNAGTAASGPTNAANYALTLSTTPQTLAARTYSGGISDFALWFQAPSSITVGGGLSQSITVTITIQLTP